jgi:hypothetical protein
VSGWKKANRNDHGCSDLVPTAVLSVWEIAEIISEQRRERITAWRAGEKNATARKTQPRAIGLYNFVSIIRIGT